MSRVNKVFLAIITLLVLVYSLLIYKRDMLLFYHNVDEKGNLNDELYLVKDIWINENHGWHIRKKGIPHSRKRVFILSMGTGAKGNYLDMLQSCLAIDENASVLVVDHPGYGITFKKLKPNLKGAKENLLFTRDKAVELGYEEIVWVTHCIGTVLLLKTESIFNHCIKQKIIVINGLIDWYDKGVQFPKNIEWIPNFIGSIIPRSIRDELNAQKDIRALLKKGISICCVHSETDKHVDISHGYSIARIIGDDRFQVIPNGRHMKVHLQSYPKVLLFLQQFVNSEE